MTTPLNRDLQALVNTPGIPGEALANVVEALRTLIDAADDYGSAPMSDDPGAEARARAKLRVCYLRYCLTPETRRALGWLLPEDTRRS